MAYAKALGFEYDFKSATEASAWRRAVKRWQKVDSEAGHEIALAGPPNWRRKLEEVQDYYRKRSGNPGRKSVKLRNFSGTVRQKPDGTVVIKGRAPVKANPSKRKRIASALKSYVRRAVGSKGKGRAKR